VSDSTGVAIVGAKTSIRFLTVLRRAKKLHSTGTAGLISIIIVFGAG